MTVEKKETKQEMRKSGECEKMAFNIAAQVRMTLRRRTIFTFIFLTRVLHAHPENVTPIQSHKHYRGINENCFCFVTILLKKC